MKTTNTVKGIVAIIGLVAAYNLISLVLATPAAAVSIGVRGV